MSFATLRPRLHHGWCECDDGTVGLLDCGFHLSYGLQAYASIIFLHSRQQLSNGISGILGVSCCKSVDFLLPQTCWQYSSRLDPGLQVRRTFFVYLGLFQQQEGKH
ncbi:unnamed protein product [Urochloa humidicola]